VPRIRSNRATTEVTLSPRAPDEVFLGDGLSDPANGANRLLAVGKDPPSSRAFSAAGDGSPPTSAAIRPRHSTRRLRCSRRGDRRRRPPRPRRAGARHSRNWSRFSMLPTRTRSQFAAACTTARVPFVVVRTAGPARGSGYSSGEFPRSKPRGGSPPALASEHGVAELFLERLGLPDLGAAVDGAIADFQSLDDRGCRPQHVDHDSPGNPGRLPWCKGDVDAHRADVSR
jgi:hypothetical protein